MNKLRRILLSLAITVTLGAFSASAFALNPTEAIDGVLVGIINAENAIETGSSPDEVYMLVKAALNASKEINANDNVAAARSRANSKLKKARGAAKKGNLQVAEEHLKAAYKAFEGLKKGL